MLSRISLSPLWYTPSSRDRWESIFGRWKQAITERRTDSERQTLCFKPSVSAQLQSELLSFCFSSVSLHWDDGKWRNFRSQTRLPVLCFFLHIFWFLGLIFRYSSRHESLRFSSLLEYRIISRNWSLWQKKTGELATVCFKIFFIFRRFERREKVREKTKNDRRSDCHQWTPQGHTKLGSNETGSLSFFSLFLETENTFSAISIAWHVS